MERMGAGALANDDIPGRMGNGSGESKHAFQTGSRQLGEEGNGPQEFDGLMFSGQVVHPCVVVRKTIGSPRWEPGLAVIAYRTACLCLALGAGTRLGGGNLFQCQGAFHELHCDRGEMPPLGTGVGPHHRERLVHVEA